MALAVCLPSSVVGAATGFSVAKGPSYSRHVAFNDVACVSKSWCWAVGAQLNPDGSPRGTLAESWNGTRWTTGSIPKNGGSFPGLYGISCVSRQFCVAVGSVYVSAEVEQPIVLMWNGKSWYRPALPALPTPGPNGDKLSSVACTSTRSCFAVGFQSLLQREEPGQPGAADTTLVERWNGRVWEVMSSPNEGPYGNLLDAVACGTNYCEAAGFYEQADQSGMGYPNPEQPLVERWNGKTWWVLPSPSNASSYAGVYGIGCSSSSRCVATVDSYDIPFGGESATVMTCSNVACILDSPPASQSPYETSGGFLQGVACAVGSQCYVVGSYAYDASGDTRTIVQVLTGTAWSRLASASPSVSSELLGIFCVGGTCMAVGSSAKGVLIERKA
jgi:hypothetical protein